MSNMSYCRFENTARDLYDCYENIDETENLSESETLSRKRMIEIAVDIALDYGHEIDREVIEE